MYCDYLYLILKITRQSLICDFGLNSSAWNYFLLMNEKMHVTWLIVYNKQLIVYNKWLIVYTLLL